MEKVFCLMNTNLAWPCKQGRFYYQKLLRSIYSHPDNNRNFKTSLHLFCLSCRNKFVGPYARQQLAYGGRAATEARGQMRCRCAPSTATTSSRKARRRTTPSTAIVLYGNKSHRNTGCTWTALYHLLYLPKFSGVAMPQAFPPHARYSNRY